MVEIEEERPEDVAGIREVTAAAFAQAPHSSGTEAEIVEALRQAGVLTLSLVAREGGELVGHVAFSPVTIEGRAKGKWFGLGPVSVRPGRQRRGIGTALIEAGLARLREMGADGCVLVGDPAYYRRFGFEVDSRLRYGDLPPGLLQKLSFTGAEAVGEVRYHAAFDGA